MPAVSIIIPTYNRLPLLQQAIASVIKQTFEDWELIVADDGSTDRTIEYLDTLQDQRIRYISLPHCGNIAHVRNTGTGIAAGEYLAFLDSDDLWLPDKLSIQLQRMQEAQLNWSYTAYEHINAENETVPARSGHFAVLSGNITASLITSKVAVSVSSLLVRKQLFNELGKFDESPRINLREDYDLALRLSLAEPTLGIPIILVQVREHAGRTTNTCTDGYERMAHVYSRFIKRTGNKDFQQLAYTRQAKQLAEATKVAFRQKNIWLTVKYLIRTLRIKYLIRHTH